MKSSSGRDEVLAGPLLDHLRVDRSRGGGSGCRRAVECVVLERVAEVDVAGAVGDEDDVPVLERVGGIVEVGEPGRGERRVVLPPVHLVVEDAETVEHVT